MPHAQGWGAVGWAAVNRPLGHPQCQQSNSLKKATRYRVGDCELIAALTSQNWSPNSLWVRTLPLQTRNSGLVDPEIPGAAHFILYFSSLSRNVSFSHVPSILYLLDICLLLKSKVNLKASTSSSSLVKESSIHLTLTME